MKPASHILIGLGIVLIVFAGGIFGYATRTDWVETSAEVTEISEVSQYSEQREECTSKTYDSEGNSRCTSYRTYFVYTCEMFVQYEFEINGMMYSGIGIDSYSTKSDRYCLEHQQERRDQLRINGTMVPIYYDSKDPSTNHYPESPSEEGWTLLAMICAGIGSLIFINGIWRLWRGYSSPRSTYAYKSYSPANDNDTHLASQKWDLAPSRIRGYNHVIQYLQSSNCADEEEMRQYLEEEFNLNSEHVDSFFQNKYVCSILFPTKNSEQNPPVLRIISDSGNDDSDSAAISSFQSLVSSDLGSSRTAQVGENSCEQEGCDNVVNDFDFRCFSCRKWLCDDHQGQGIHCPDCV